MASPKKPEQKIGKPGYSKVMPGQRKIAKAPATKPVAMKRTATSARYALNIKRTRAVSNAAARRNVRANTGAGVSGGNAPAKQSGISPLDFFGGAGLIARDAQAIKKATSR